MMRSGGRTTMATSTQNESRRCFDETAARLTEEMMARRRLMQSVAEAMPIWSPAVTLVSE
jgi:hypothetical protein